jgi:hypothetical protein
MPLHFKHIHCNTGPTNLGIWVSFPRKAKTPIVKGIGEDREVAVGTTYVGGAWAVTRVSLKLLVMQILLNLFMSLTLRRRQMMLCMR